MMYLAVHAGHTCQEKAPTLNMFSRIVFKASDNSTQGIKEVQLKMCHIHDKQRHYNELCLQFSIFMDGISTLIYMNSITLEIFNILYSISRNPAFTYLHVALCAASAIFFVLLVVCFSPTHLLTSSSKKRMGNHNFQSMEGRMVQRFSL